MMGSKAFESPLISHVRMRGMYRALVETRLLADHIGKRRPWPRNLEACWVGTSIDLKPGDLTSLSAGEWLIDHVVAVGERVTANAASRKEIAKALRAHAAQSKSAPNPASGFERLLTAIGMAAALHATSPKAVVVAYLAANELSAAEWRRVLTLTRHQLLPLVLVVTPAPARSKPTPDISAIVHRMRIREIPVIPVDAGDVVGIYRVAQETLSRARHDGGLAIIECIAFGLDPIKTAGAQLVAKKICTQRWVEGVAPSFAALLPKP